MRFVTKVTATVVLVTALLQSNKSIAASSPLSSEEKP
jgi:hypothetical protein